MPALDLSAWRGAPRMGQPVTGFIALKTPIDFTAWADGLSDDDKDELEFSVSMFMERQSADGRAIGLVVDLTTPQPDGRRLYDTDEWERDWDVEYVSLPCVPALPEASSSAAMWSEPIPTEEAISAFTTAVGRFWAQPANRRRHIAVHCVTGVNVAGVMITRFLSRNAPVGKVLAAFAKARPPGIYAPDALEAIWHASAPTAAGGAKVTAADGGWMQPQPPEWHPLPYRAVDRTSRPALPSKPKVPLFDAARAEQTAAAATSSQPGKRPVPEGMQPPPPAKAAAKTAASSVAAVSQMDANAPQAESAPDDSPLALRSVARRLPTEEASSLRSKCVALVDLPAVDAAAVNVADPGLLPCFSHGERLNTDRLEGMRARNSAWLVTWKARGERCLLLVLGSASDGGGSAAVADAAASRCVLLDSRGNAYELDPMRWPKAPDGAGGSDASSQHNRMVVAGELVRDSEGGGAPAVWRLLCYDLLAIDGKSLVASPLTKRMALLSLQLNARKAPAHAAAVNAERLRVRQKDCFRLKHVGHLLRKFLPKLTHPAVGLVFLEAESSAKGGTSATVLDWRREGTGEVPESELLAFADAHFQG